MGLTIAAAVFLGLAALIHAYIFVLESILWTRPATMRTFGLRSAEEAETVRPMAYNQGFYNLFLGAGVAVGIVLLFSRVGGVGAAVALFGASCMVLAAVVLITSNPKLARSALVQGLAPLVGIVLLVLALATGSVGS